MEKKSVFMIRQLKHQMDWESKKDNLQPREFIWIRESIRKVWSKLG